LGRSNPGYLKFLNWNVSTKKQVPRNDQFLFILNILYLKNEVFELTEGKNLYGKIWKSEEFAWKCEGFIKKNEEIYIYIIIYTWKSEEFD